MGRAYVLKASKSLVYAGRLKVSRCAGTRGRRVGCGAKQPDFGEEAPIDVGKVNFGGAEEVGFALAWLRGERSSGGRMTSEKSET